MVKALWMHIAGVEDYQVALAAYRAACHCCLKPRSPAGFFLCSPSFRQMAPALEHLAAAWPLSALAKRAILRAASLRRSCSCTIQIIWTSRGWRCWSASGAKIRLTGW
jgi:hypothetical protein